MTICRSCGPFGSGNNASVVTSVIETDEDVVLDECGSVVCVIGDGEVTVTLPDGAPGGTEVLILAESGSARVLGPVAGGPQTVRRGTACRLVMGCAGEFLSECCCPPSPTGSGLVGPTGASGPPAPRCQVSTQPEWHVNAVTGSDAADGSTAATALRTFRELLCRIGVYGLVGIPGGGLVTVFLDSDLPDDDPVTPLFVFLPGTRMAIVGTATEIVRSGVFSAVILQDPATNQPYVVTDPSAATWSDALLARIRVTSGAAAGAISYVALPDVAPGAARTSNFAAIDVPNTTVVPLVPSPGDAYVVERLTSVVLGSADVVDGVLIFQDLLLRAVDVDVRGSSIFVFAGVVFDVSDILALGADENFYLDCLNASAPVTLLGKLHFFLAGLSRNFAAVEDAAVTFDADFMFEGGHFECNGGRAYVAALAVFDSPSDHGIHVHAGTGTLLISGDFGPPRLWGAGNAGHGVDVEGGADLLHPLGFLPTITGALGDFTLGGNASSRSWDDTLGAYTAPFANTWANLAAVPGQDAHNVAADAHIVVDTS